MAAPAAFAPRLSPELRAMLARNLASEDGEDPEEILTKHILQKEVNHIWVEKVCTGQPPEEHDSSVFFPYKIGEGNEFIGSVMQKGFQPQDQNHQLPEGDGSNPLFIVNIPMAHNPRETGYDRVSQTLSLLARESFGESEEDSRREVRKNLAVVIGINQIHSVDPSVNRAFRRYINRAPTQDQVPCRLIGFFWDPTWTTNNYWASDRRVDLNQTYDLCRAFMLLKVLNRQKAEEVRSSLEGTSEKVSSAIRKQVPFQEVRERIKKSSTTSSFLKHAEHTLGETPTYFVTMDSDTVQLRTGRYGYFSLYSQEINSFREQNQPPPSILTLGYQLEQTAHPLAQVAVRCDMFVRQAMHAILPGSAYLPEPGTCYFLGFGKQAQDSLKRFSFVGKANKKGLESRRAFKKGLESGLFSIDRIVMVAKGSLVTKTPSRMIAPFKKIRRANLKQLQTLKQLRKVSQVHFKKLQWAHNLYEALPKGKKPAKGDAQRISGILSSLYEVFDPIDFVESLSIHFDHESEETFDTAFSLYTEYSEYLWEQYRRKQEDPPISLPNRLQPFAELIRARQKSLEDALIKLNHLSDPWKNRVVLTAFSSGAAFFEGLKESIGLGEQPPPLL